MLEELGQDYEYELVQPGKIQSDYPEYLDVNPAAKVPAIRDGDFVLSESAAIILYLGDKFPEQKLVPPPRTELRARHEQWCFFALTELEQPLWNMVKHRYALPKEHRVREILETANWEYQKTLNLLADGLGENTFILGQQFHGVDILLGHCLRWGLAFKQPLEQENLRDYLERLSLRPALERAQTRESEAATTQ
jgi:glutathione S-transferase